MNLTRSEVRVLTVDGAKATVAARVREDEPVFEGHYPARAVFPGVCVVDLVCRGAAAAFDREVVLTAIESAQFRAAIGPGDELEAELTWQDGDRLAAVVAAGGDQAAKLRLRVAPRGRS